MLILEQDLTAVLDRTRPLWEELRGGRLFITGGTGFFGRWLLETFAHANKSLRLNAEAVVLTRDPEAFCRHSPHLAVTGGIRLLHGDVINFNRPDLRFTHIIHAASELSVGRPKDPIGLIETSLAGTRRVLELARNSGAKKFLFTSSGAVYGPMFPGRGRVAEGDLVSPLPLEGGGAYAESKRLAEIVACIFGREHGIEVKIARGFAFLGPFLDLCSHLAAAGFLRSALAGEPILIQGHGQTVRSYLYGADLAVWIWTILFNGQPGQPYNLGSDIPVTIEELARVVSSACSPSNEVRILGRLQESELIDFYVPDLTKARSELGLEVFTPLPEAVQRTLLFHSQYYQNR